MGRYFIVNRIELNRVFITDQFKNEGEKRMQKRSALFSLFFLMFIAFDVISGQANSLKAASGEYRFKIDFGKAQPVETIMVERNLSIKTIQGENRIRVDFEPYLANQKGEHIPIKRLELSINDRKFQLDDGAFEIDTETLSINDKLFLTFNLSLSPVDHPGLYQGVMSIQTPQKKIIFQLGVEVQPWVRMETDERFINLDQVSKEDLKVKSPMPLTVRVASNTNWVLSANLEKENKVPLLLKLGRYNGGNDIQNLFLPGGRLGIEKLALAAGAATVKPSESYWSELSFDMFIDDFIKYPAGEQLFKIRFLLELWEQKTVNL